MTQWELAQKAGVSDWTISQLENGTQTSALPKTIRSLARALGIVPTELVSWDEDDTPTQEIGQVG